MLNPNLELGLKIEAIVAVDAKNGIAKDEEEEDEYEWS